MKTTTLGRVLCSVALMASATAPALALDYEAKPIKRVIAAPFKTMGALSGALVCGAFSGPVDKGYHWSLKGTKHVAGKFGDENGQGQLAAAAPLGGTAGALLGGAYGVPSGALHGFKKGWDKPFSRWSYVTREEK